MYELNWTHLKTPVVWSSLCTILTSLIWCLMNLSFLKCQLYQLNSGGSPDSTWISSPFLCPVNFLLTKCWLTIHSTVFISHYTGITVLCCLALNDLRSVILYIIFTFFKLSLFILIRVQLLYNKLNLERINLIFVVSSWLESLIYSIYVFKNDY